MERLPRELMIDITSRLPMKYVLRCKCVSKSWEALLSDPSFAAAHFNRASTLTPFSHYMIFSQSIDDKLLYFIEIEEEENETSTTSKAKHLDFPFVTNCLAAKFTRPMLVGSCRGYVCFLARQIFGGALCPIYPPYDPMYLFNPITGANILLPQFEESWPSTCLYGFGLDVSTQECKVVLVYLYPEIFSVQVHTVGRDYSWRTNTVPTMLADLTEAELMNHELQVSLPLEFNGSIHWIVLSSADKDNKVGPKRARILSFQLDTEVFRLIPLPEPLRVMEPYFHNSMRISQIRPIGFQKNGELMLHLENGGLVSYNPDSDTYKILNSDISFSFPFVGSLISLKSTYGDNEGDVLFSVAFVEGHKKAKGGYHNKETKDLMERVTSRTQHTSSSSTSTKSCFSDIYRLQSIIQDETGKEDHGGYCRGLGSGVTRRRLSHPVGTFQTLTQSHINQMKDDLNRGREDVEHFKEEAKCARAEAERERMKRVAAEANAKTAIMRYKALEEVQRSTLQMFIDLQQQFNELQRKT